MAEDAEARYPEAGTSAERDRVADFVRLLAIIVVVLGHWLAPVVLVREGQIEVTNLLEVAPWMRWLTWVFQVVPIFFLAGGLANARSWERAVASGESWWSWLQRRTAGLVAPVGALAVAWVALALAFWTFEPSLAATASRAAFAPLWFLVVYVVAVASTPWTVALHRRVGLAAPVTFTVSALVVDVVARLWMEEAALLNMVFVWLGAHQIGYFWNDGRLPRGPVVGLGIAAIGLAGAAALVVWSGYPVSMTTVGGDVPNNSAPPTVAVLALAVAQAGIVGAVHGPLDSWLRRSRSWSWLRRAGPLVLPVYVWHATAVVVAAYALHGTGLWEPAELDATWWAMRPAFLALCAGVLAFFLGVARIAKQDPRRVHSRARIAVGILGALVGIGWINQVGYDVATPIVSTAGVVVLLAGLWSLGVLGGLGPSARQEQSL